MAPENYLALKRSMQYAAKVRGSRTCGACEHRVKVKYRGGTMRTNCRAIGVADTGEAEVVDGGGCRAWKARPQSWS
jgi:hypothetical protein